MGPLRSKLNLVRGCVHSAVLPWTGLWAAAFLELASASPLALFLGKSLSSDSWGKDKTSRLVGTLGVVCPRTCGSEYAVGALGSLRASKWGDKCSPSTENGGGMELLRSRDGRMQRWWGEGLGGPG